MTLRKLLIALGRKFPKNLSESFDFPGYQCGNKNLNREINKIFLCLDFTEACLDECISYQPDLILTHHPFYFGNKKEIALFDPKKIILEGSLNEKINCPIYSFHTDYDKANGGMNDFLLNQLGFKNISVCEDGLMRIVTLSSPTTIENVMKRLCDYFGFHSLSYLSFHRPIQKLAFVAGGGGNMSFEALKEKVDLFISGDSAHHSRLDMRRYQLNYIELPHECEEKGFILGMCETIHQLDPEIEIYPFYYEKYYSLYLPKTEN